MIKSTAKEYILTLVSLEKLDFPFLEKKISTVLSSYDYQSIKIKVLDPIDNTAADFFFTVIVPSKETVSLQDTYHTLHQVLTRCFVETPIDFCLQQNDPLLRRKKVFFSDICLLGLLKDIDTEKPTHDLVKPINIEPDVQTLIGTMKHHGVHTLLVTEKPTSEKPSLIEEQIYSTIGIEVLTHNHSEVNSHVTTDNHFKELANPDPKLDILNRWLYQHGLLYCNVVALCNQEHDIPMLKVVGLGVKYRGTSTLQDSTQPQINHTRLTSALYYQGYHRNEFVNNHE